MTKKVRDSLGDDYKDYSSFSYPTNNFGLLTLYTPSGGSEKVYDRDFLCDMWNCIGVADNNIPADQKKALAMNGYAAAGDDGAAITLTEKESKTIALDATLPEIYKVLKLSGSVSNSSVVETDLKLGRAYPRKARRAELSQYLNNLPAGDKRKVAYLKGDLLLIVADVVVDSIQVTIKADSDLSAKLDAAIGAPVGNAGKIFKDASMSVKATSSTKGTYTFEVTKPVILMRLAKKQPAGGELGRDEDWKDWESAVVTIFKDRPVVLPK
jgi:hypothetical protein